VGKAEGIPEGANPRLVITHFPPEEDDAHALYEQGDCARRNRENRIQEQKLDLIADRASPGTLRANQLRLWLSTLAYRLVNQLRRGGLAGPKLAQATRGTIRVRLFKIGAVVRVTVRRVWVSLSSAYPLAELLGLVARRLRRRESG
jgi:hypothetical protein